MLAQTPSGPTRKAPPPPPPPPATDQQQFLSYWTTETGWRTELQLRNNQVGHDLIVTPVLGTADGTETPLSPVTVQPQEVKTVDVETAIGSSAPQLIGTYGSLALRYRTPSQANLYAVSMVMGVGHSIAFHPLGVPLSFTSDQGVYGHDKCGGLWEDISDAFYSNWSTANSNITTVDYYGTHTGMSIGSTTSSTSGQFQGWLRLNDCPIVGSAPSGGANVHTVTISGAQSIMDGQQSAFSVSVSGGTATAYSWSFTAPSGAGNGPNVSFTAPTSAQTNTDGHWFALPNVACPSQSDLPGYYNSVYTIKATVTFSEGDDPSKSTTLTVNSYWNPAGFTDPNIARIGGVPNMASDNPDGSNK